MSEMDTTDQIKVLMIDDDELIARSTAKYFNFVGVKTAYVTTYEDAVEFLEHHTVSLLLLDINLGERSGFDLCTEIREKYDMQILFISARTSDDDVLIALNIGGDDYITKPFTTNILLAKVKAVLARYEKAKEDAMFVAASYQAADRKNNEEKILIRDGVYLDTSLHKLEVKGHIEELRDMEYKLLLYLLENAGRVVTKDELLQKVWEDEYTCDATITVHIRELRGKLEPDPKKPTVIKTVWGVGYVIEKGD